MEGPAGDALGKRHIHKLAVVRSDAVTGVFFSRPQRHQTIARGCGRPMLSRNDQGRQAKKEDQCEAANRGGSPPDGALSGRLPARRGEGARTFPRVVAIVSTSVLTWLTFW